jgi:tetratricopeptide (TPR) repeat protein
MRQRELPAEVYADIVQLCERGDGLADNERYSEALATYWRAWDMLPEPKTEWEAATWILAAIGDANFQRSDYAAGRDNLSSAMRCPGAIGNPFLHLRLGQCQLELGDLERAADELMRAYISEGPTIFAEEDPRYLSFLRSRARLDGS